MCVNLDGSPVAERDEDCDRPWCYVNPLCEAQDVRTSLYFPDAGLKVSLDACNFAAYPETANRDADQGAEQGDEEKKDDEEEKKDGEEGDNMDNEEMMGEDEETGEAAEELGFGSMKLFNQINGLITGNTEEQKPEETKGGEDEKKEDDAVMEDKPEESAEQGKGEADEAKSGEDQEKKEAFNLENSILDFIRGLTSTTEKDDEKKEEEIIEPSN